MNQRRKVLAFVMAGGEGRRLAPLTDARSKPSVPFGGRHHLIDFAISNLVNSEILAVYLLVQYKSQSLIDHVRTVWPMNPMLANQFVSVVPPQMHLGRDWFLGTADSVGQNVHLIEQHRPDLVVVFGADHVYRMDVRRMIRHHLDRGADVTVASVPVPLAEASAFGVLRTDATGRVLAFEEKPARATPMAGSRTHALASMGNYLFSTGTLLEVLRDAHARGLHDFGQHVLPSMLASHHVLAHDFAEDRVPGFTEGEEAGYWRDVGTIESYFAANFDTLGEHPKFRLQNPAWPIYGSVHLGEAAQVTGGSLEDVSLGGGSTVSGARLKRAILRRDVHVAADARLDDCIVMDRSVIGRGAQVRRAIIDQDNIVPPGMRIGWDPDADRKRFHVSDSGIVVVARGQLK